LVRDNEKGAARARNLGLSYATGEIVLFLEDDLEITQKNLVEAHLEPYQDPTIGGVSGRVIEAINRSARGPVGKIYPLIFIPGGNGDGQRRQYIETVKGGNMSFRRDVLKRIGGFDERFGHPSMYEETDVSLKIRRLGYKLLFVPEACVVHLSAPKGGQRTNYDPARFRFIAYRDRVLLFRNNYPAWLYLFFLLSNFGLAVMPGLRGNWKSAQLGVAGLFDGIQKFGNVKRA
jgi:GT2 family glycosyltransferase